MNSFGNASVDIDMLEREMSAEAAQDSTRRNADLSGNIAGMSAPKTSSAFSSSSSNRRGPMQEIRLDSEFDTLEEPVWDTVKRDMQTVGAKFGHVILPHGDKQQLLRDWDLWGPLFICVGLALLLQYNGGTEAAPQFTQVFTITFFGSVVVTANIKLLGGNISFFQSLCVIGYCLLPPFVSAVLCSIFLHGMVFPIRLFDNFHRICLVDLCLNGIFGRLPTRKKRLLVIYPVFLFYFVVSWMIISHS
ncbi:unnamed protein product [Caenorhabditis angaria]|uniref:Protein YIPF n=1 Tax=Caenorhabditis angaria TaxID=860376 RepID=A0A9P1MTU2_9PELO|nr:unnamed protein product [Caenorhabditis angaria]